MIIEVFDVNEPDLKNCSGGSGGAYGRDPHTFVQDDVYVIIKF